MIVTAYFLFFTSTTVEAFFGYVEPFVFNVPNFANSIFPNGQNPAPRAEGGWFCHIIGLAAYAEPKA